MSTLAVNTITAETGNTVSLASGKTLDASQGLTVPAGHVIQVKNHTIDPGTQSTSSGTLVETGLTINITPTSTSSKILILASMHECYIPASQKAIGLAIAKNGTRLYDTDNATLGYTNSAGANYFNANLQAYDSPNTTSQVTYSVMARSIYSPQSVAWCGDNTPSFLTVMEIAG